MVLAGSRRDYRHADSFGWYRSWQDHLSPCSPERSWEGAVAEEVHAEAAHYLHSQHTELFDRDGGMFGGSLPWARVARARPRCQADPSSVREAICEVQQERLS